MDKFNDEFSFNSYEELLNEYAGESLGSHSARTSKSEDEKAAKTSPKRTAPQEPVPQKRPAPAPAPRQRTAPAPAPRQRTAPAPTPAPRQRTAPAPAPTPAPRRTAPAEPARTQKSRNDLNKEKFGYIEPFEAEERKSDTMEFKKAPQKPIIEKRYSPAQKAPAEKPKKQKSNKRAPIAVIRNPKVKGKKRAPTEIFADALLFVRTNSRVVITFAVCVLIASVLSGVALSCINDVLAINRKDDTPVEVVLPNNATTSDAIDVLHDAGLIKNKLFCNMFIGFMESLDKVKKDYLPGVYYFTEDMGVEKMIKRFKTSSTRGATISVTIPEGYTVDQIISRLEKNEICSASALYKTIDQVDFSEEYDFINALDYKENRYHVLEGYMFPATYEFQQGADPATVIRTFLNQFKKRWTDEYTARAAELSMSVDDIVTIASIIEKEAYGEEQFPLVSSVLHNRLNRSLLYPTLDCDSTKVYVTTTIAERITAPAELQKYILNYSTNECAGLPAGAICNPGEAAIKAALYPETNQYYFFAHDAKKKLYLAKTVEEHDANLRTIAKVNEEA